MQQEHSYNLRSRGPINPLQEKATKIVSSSDSKNNPENMVVVDPTLKELAVPDL